MKKTMFALLALVALALPGLEIAKDARLLQERLGLTDCPGIANRHGWTCPSEVTVSNQVFKLVDVRVFGDDLHVNFDLVDQRGWPIAWGRIEIATSAEHAVRTACRSMVADYTGTVDDLAKRLRVEKDADGAVFVENSYELRIWNYMNHSMIYGVYGNLFIRMAVATHVSVTRDCVCGSQTFRAMRIEDVTKASAWDFAKPLILGGLGELTEEQKQTIRKLEESEKKWILLFRYGIGVAAMAGLAVFLFMKSRKGEPA